MGMIIVPIAVGLIAVSSILTTVLCRVIKANILIQVVINPIICIGVLWVLSAYLGS